MRIAFLTLEYPPAGGGIASSLATIGPALVQRGHEVQVVGWADRARCELDRGVQVNISARTKIPRLGWLLNPRAVENRLGAQVQDGELDVVVAHDWCGPSALVRPGCPVVVWCNGSATYFSDLTGENVRGRVARSERLALTRAASVAAASRFTAERTKQLFQLDQTPRVVFNPVDTTRFAPTIEGEVQSDTFLYVGTIVRKKGVLDLCRAFNRVVAKSPEARLVVAGRDSRDSETAEPSTWKLCQEILSAEAAKRTSYRGFVPYAEIESLIRTCLAAVLPSYAEALPLSWMEVMACGRPVIAADVGWAPELIRSGQDGLLVQASSDLMLAEAMLRLLGDPDAANQFGASARQWMVEQFSPVVVAEQFEAWLGDVLRGPVAP